MNKKFLYIALRILIVIASVILGIFAIYFIGSLLIPFIIAFFIAMIINPLVNFFQIKVKMPRGYAVIVSILIITGAISTIITLLVNEIIQGFTYLSNVVPDHYNDLSVYMEEMYQTKIFPFYNNLLDLFQNLDQSQKSTILESMQFMGEKLTNTISSIIQSIGNFFYAIFKGLPNIVTILVISLLATFFISKDWNHIVSVLLEKVPNKIQVRINSIYEGLQRALLGYLRAEFKITFISAIIVFIGLLILQVEHALTIALIIWLVDFLPYIGAILIFLPWAIYCFSTGDYFLGTGLSILYGLIVVQRQLIKPKILSSSLGISPLMTLLTMYVGFKLMGFVGIIIGPLTFILLKIFHETGILHDVWTFIVGKKSNP